MAMPQEANQRWSIDFVQDALDDGRRFRMLNVVDEFKHGGLHPGYAFPVWHSAVALVARLSDVDPATAMS